MRVITGLDRLNIDKNLQNQFKGKVALLCHNASVDLNLKPAVLIFKRIFSSRFIKIFGPQHGFSTDAQDNMIETDHILHPYLNIPVYSLYSETRIPTDDMLAGIDHLFIDLQDVGCRMYTYIYTLTLLLEKCVQKDVQIIVLDRPNPINGEDLEGNILDLKFESFIGRHAIPVRHGLTIAEIALMHQKFWVKEKVDLKIIKMQNWNREMYFEDTKLPWILPSPNLAREESACTFPALVLFEGTNLSEGRGTTQPLEIVGHPKLEPYRLYVSHLQGVIKKSKLNGFVLRPITFLPTFQKHSNEVCGGFQVHITDRKLFKPWRVGQLLLRELFHNLGGVFEWKKPPYEYNYIHKPIDIINGTDKLRLWVEANETVDMLNSFENFEDFNKLRNEIKIY